MSERQPNAESELIDYVRSIDVRAPQELHERIEQLVSERSPARGRSSSARAGDVRGRRLAAGLALATAAVAVLVVAVSSGGGGGGGGLTVSEASALTQRAATATAPKEVESSGGTHLNAAVDGVSFPYWAEHFGWRATGARVDHVAGRTVRTVFYSNARGQRIGYAIASGKTAPHTSGGTTAWRHETPYRLMRAGDLRVVTWTRDGHLCVVAGRGVSSATLLTLASWDDHGRAAA